MEKIQQLDRQFCLGFDCFFFFKGADREWIDGGIIL